MRWCTAQGQGVGAAGGWQSVGEAARAAAACLQHAGTPAGCTAAPPPALQSSSPLLIAGPSPAGLTCASLRVPPAGSTCATLAIQGTCPVISRPHSMPAQGRTSRAAAAVVRARRRGAGGRLRATCSPLPIHSLLLPPHPGRSRRRPRSPLWLPHPAGAPVHSSLQGQAGRRQGTSCGVPVCWSKASTRWGEGPWQLHAAAHAQHLPSPPVVSLAVTTSKQRTVRQDRECESTSLRGAGAQAVGTRPQRPARCARRRPRQGSTRRGAP